MSQPIAFNPNAFNPATPIQSFQIMTNNLDQILERFGAETAGNAATIVGLKAFAEKLKELIDCSNLPCKIKELAKEFIDGHVDSVERQLAVPGDAVDAVANCDAGAQISEAATGAATGAAAQATVATSSTPMVEAESEAMLEAANEGPDSPQEVLTGEAADEAAQEAANEGPDGSTAAPTGGAEAGTGAGGSTALDSSVEDLGKVEKNDTKKAKGNWLLILAQNLAEIQAKFLGEAIDASKTMSENSADSTDGDGTAVDKTKSKAFLDAQAKYTANMQMFNIFSQQVSTSIKTIGESLSAISRKQ